MYRMDECTLVAYNNRCLHSSLGNIPPEEYEHNHYDETTGSLIYEAANKTAA